MTRLLCAAILAGLLALAGCTEGGAPPATSDAAPVSSAESSVAASTTPEAKPSAKRSASKPKNDPRYRTCAEANAHGYGPYRRGEDPEYRWYRDQDKDGKACEPKER